MPVRTEPGVNRQSGFTLIEVLVTIFVAGIGLLAVAGLQVMSKKFNYDALQRTTAATLAQSMVEVMRGNPANLDAYLTSDASAVSAGSDCAADAAQCSPAELAAYDLHRWSQDLAGAAATADGLNAGGLVNPTGCVARDASVPGLYLVAVAWQGVTGVDPPGADAADDDPALNPCGEGLGRYDDPRSAGEDDRLRRVLVVNAFVSDPNAL